MTRSNKTDNANTALNIEGERISKNDILIHFLGTLDELNSHLGLVKVKITDSDDKKFIEKIQVTIMKLMAHVSDIGSEKYFLSEKEVTEVEEEIKKYKDYLPQHFVIPGISETDAVIHIARTVARRAERYMTAVIETKLLCEFACIYLNKLSEYLFVLSCKQTN